MSPEQERQLEREIDLALKRLPELQAPQALMRQVMQALEERMQLPWYRKSWQNWPPTLRWASVALLVAFFGALCAGGWFVPQTAEYTGAVHKASGLVSILNTLWSAVNALLAALVFLFKRLGTAGMLACLGGVAMAWVLCFGLGTACLRLAFAERGRGQRQW